MLTDTMSMFERPHAFEVPGQERLRLAAKASELLANGTDYERTLDFVAELLVSSLASWCTIDLLTPSGLVERVGAAHRDPSKNELTRLMLDRYPASPKAKRGVYRVIETREAILIPVMTREVWAARADDARHLDMIMELGSTSYMCVPLLARGRIVGAIVCLSNERTYTDEDLETAMELARLIALAVDNVSMFREMRSALTELETANRQLVQSSKLAALGVISAGIAHEINNPLTVIRCLVTQIQTSFERDRPPTKWEVAAISEKLQRHIDRIVNIVNNVKQFSRRPDQIARTFDLREVMAAAIGLTSESVTMHKIRISQRWPMQKVMIKGEPVRLEQVFVNLLTNAIDAIVTRHLIGGQIDVEVVRDEKSSSWRVSISDDGVGIPAPDKAHVFEPFYTTKEAGKGTGLGLSISHEIVQDHGGRMTLSSREGRGTVVTVQLPALEKSEPAILRAPSSLQ